MRMKVRKNITLSKEAVARGERLAAERATSLSQIIEDQLLAVPVQGGGLEAVTDYWPGPGLKPLPRAGDPRSAYLKRKHG